MISAQEARNYNVSLTNEYTLQLDEIEEKIISALCDLNKFTWFYKKIRPVVLIELKRLGYTVACRLNQRHEETYKISW